MNTAYCFDTKTAFFQSSILLHTLTYHWNILMILSTFVYTKTGRVHFACSRSFSLKSHLGSCNTVLCIYWLNATETQHLQAIATRWTQSYRSEQKLWLQGFFPHHGESELTITNIRWSEYIWATACLRANVNTLAPLVYRQKNSADDKWNFETNLSRCNARI